MFYSREDLKRVLIPIVTLIDDNFKKVERIMSDQQAQLDALTAALVAEKTKNDLTNTAIGNLDVEIKSLQAAIASGTPPADLNWTNVNAALAALQGTDASLSAAVSQDVTDATTVVPTPLASIPAQATTPVTSSPSSASTEVPSTTNPTPAQ